VDDNATNRHILEEWLRGWRMDPVAAGDGLAALDALWHAASAGRPYALVLLDARMPDTDGLALAAEIRKRAELSATRIILLSSGDNPGEPARSREQRVDAHLLKPVQQEELLEAIYRVMSRGIGVAPPAAGPAGGGEQTRVPAPTARPLSVLVADDNVDNAMVLELLLGRCGHRVRVAANGREALAALEEQPFDLVLMDVQMPEMDGLEATAAIRRHEGPAGGHVPIIGLTAHAVKGYQERCLEAGMDAYITKPIHPRELLGAIERLGLSPTPAPGESSTEAPGMVMEGGQTRGQTCGGFDEATALARAGGDRELLKFQVSLFLANCAGYIARIRAAVADKDCQAIRHSAHNLKGQVGAFSSSAMEAAQRVQEMAEEGSLDSTGDALTGLEAEIERLKPALADWLTAQADEAVQT
jgi:CheY-like chemotaxis protein